MTTGALIVEATVLFGIIITCFFNLMYAEGKKKDALENLMRLYYEENRVFLYSERILLLASSSRFV